MLPRMIENGTSGSVRGAPGNGRSYREMQDDSMNKAKDLAQIGYDLAEEIRDGKRDHISDLKKKPAPACIELTDEFRRRYPGYSLEQYQRALADGLFAWR